MSLIKLETELSHASGINDFLLKRLHRLGIKTVRDLLWHFPVRYEDFSRTYTIGDLEPGQQATIKGRVEDIQLKRTWKRNLSIVEASLVDDTGSIRAVWFNQPYVLNVLRPGRLANFSGKVSLSDGELYFSQPAYEILRKQIENAETKHTGRLVPIYPETRGLTSRGLRFLVKPVLQNMLELDEWLPEEVLNKQNLPEVNEALQAIHFPAVIEEAIAAKQRFEFEDLFLLQLVNLQHKMKFAAAQAPALPADVEWIKSILAGLPYELTPSQKKSLWEIMQDVAKPHPMNRLLQGDVGSGKTVIAAITSLIAAKNRYQTAFMAPTEVLARQHFSTFRKFLKGIPAADQKPVAILTSSSAEIIYETDLETEISKKELLAKINSGEVSIIIGTHALIQQTVGFHNLGFVVVDEQHRFGVRQRQALAAQMQSNMIPHFLSMSATPIPRTLMLTIFGDLDVSLITELPAGRKPITSKIVGPQDRPKTYDFIRAEVKKGRQVFVICPRIEPKKENDETVTHSRWQQLLAQQDIKSVKEEFEKLSKKIFPDFRVAMLHGRMKAEEKNEVMRAFSAGETDILVSTSVIEVGIDVPNATIMMIEGSERFGLAQLYQFRGRVGRGEHQSYCFLFTESDAKNASARLKAILEAKNGLELAEKDLKIRGPGEFLGEAQTGLPDYAMAGLQNLELVKSSREAAAEVLKSDRTLKDHPELKVRAQQFERTLHGE